LFLSFFRDEVQVHLEKKT